MGRIHAFLPLSVILYTVAAQQCTYLNEIKEEAWVKRGGDMAGFEFPAEIKRVFPGTLDRECDAPPPAGQPRDPDFCLPQRPFARNKQPVCNRCPPTPKNYFRLALWEKYADFRAILKKGRFWRRSPHLFEPRPDGRGPSRQLKHGFCMTCYALAKRPPPQVMGPNDVRKPSVTVTTRVACGRQNAGKDGFLMPDQTLLEMWNTQIQTLTKNDDPCTHFPCGDNEEVARRAQKLAQVKQIAGIRDEHIASFIKNFTDHRTGEVKAVNGHHNDLMEIPYGKAHVLRTEINLNRGLEGYSADIADGGYSYFDENGEEQFYDGCQAMEYGMVALSPGLVETACWLVPLFADEAGNPDPAVGRWRAEERRKDAEIKAKVASEAVKMKNMLHRYCIRMRPKMSRALDHGGYERATRTCELLFCNIRHPRRTPAFRACRQVIQDAAEYKKLAQQRAAEAAEAQG